MSNKRFFDPRFHLRAPETPFVGRQRELASLIDAVGDDGAIAEVTGLAGAGKTALLRALERAAPDRFPGGVEWFSGSESFQLSEALDVIADQFRNRPGHHLLIVDDADRLDTGDLLETINRLSTGPWSFSTIVASRRTLGFSRKSINLGGLDQSEFEAFARSLFGEAIDQDSVQRLYEVSSGLPLTAYLLNELRRAGRGSDDPAGLLLPFTQSGLVDPYGRPLSDDAAATKRIIVDVGAVNDEFLRRAADDPNFVFSITPRQFEELVAELLTRIGYDVELTQKTRDGGKDIYAAKRDGLGTFLFLVECKRYSPDNPVGVEIIRALHGVADIERVTGSMVVTTSYFSRDARELASQIRYRMSLKEYLDVRQWLVDLRPR